MRAKQIFKEKRVLTNLKNLDLAIAELKVWEVPKSNHYPEGIKYSLYLVKSGQVIVGFDNHSPKGHHLHIGENEILYEFKSVKALLDDFWNLVKERGFQK